MKRSTRSLNGVDGHEQPVPPLKRFIKTGCTLLNLVIGGGWPLGRIANIVGDKSTGKTLLAIEAAANFARDFPEGKIWYREAEAAFDKEYAESLGMPLEKISFGKDKLDTVEDFYEDLTRCCKNSTKAGLYILDSLDALSDRKELAREIDKGSYGADKAKQMSQLFRKSVRAIEDANICVIVISQVRDKIGVTFGRKTTRSGGRALDFYASQVLYLSHIETLYRTRKGQKRSVGIRIRAKCEKNKIGLPHRECEFPIIYGYGVDDNQANADWLKSIGELHKQAIPDKSMAKQVRLSWRAIDREFLPKTKKYSNEQTT